MFSEKINWWRKGDMMDKTLRLAFATCFYFIPILRHVRINVTSSSYGFIRGFLVREEEEEEEKNF
ncbi:hypothetical protein OUZ56_031897 [Daphnia magna]|uniref:Transmembrane protein n=1 Tax=Daphnia magna TaxID=35525 RepID=A0ABQ9ZVJ2_9CRUS|nr:hypothetical protein OUZ56_031897 [Daphnia magna]